jgi:hypothetical protein
MILRRLKDVKKIDVGKAFGFPEKMMVIQVCSVSSYPFRKNDVRKR